MHNKVIMFNAYLTSKKILQKNVFYFFSPLLHNGIQISYSLSFSSLDTPIPPQCPYMSPFLSKSPTAKFNATSAGGMQLTAVDVCSPIARLLLNYYKHRLVLCWSECPHHQLCHQMSCRERERESARERERERARAR